MKTYLLAFSLFLSVAPIWSQSRAERKALKKEKETAAYQDIKSLLDEGAFFFNADWVYPRAASQINLIDNPGIIRFKSADSVRIHLPYFGIVRIGGGFNQTPAIQYTGSISEYKVVHNDDKLSSIVSFIAESPTEVYDVSMTVFSNGGASIFVNSTKRDGIRYRGTVATIDEKTLPKT